MTIGNNTFSIETVVLFFILITPPFIITVVFIIAELRQRSQIRKAQKAINEILDRDRDIRIFNEALVRAIRERKNYNNKNWSITNKLDTFKFFKE